jgi:GNAT superfamily N-acetyltransferase
MSVVVHPDYQGQGLAKRLMAEFIERMRGMDKATIHLMCKEAYCAVRRVRLCLHQAVGVRPWRDGVARDDPHFVRHRS